MAYIGSDPINKGTGLFSQDTFTGDGSTTTFDLANVIPDGGGNDIQVFVDNVRQQEGSSKAYTIGEDGSGDLKRVTFTTAPAAAASIYVLNPGTRNVLQVTSLSDNSVSTAKLQNTSVTTAKLGADAVTGAKLADDAVDSEHLVDASIDHVHLANDAVDGDNIADDSISEEHLDVTAITGNTELSAVASSDDVLLVFDTSSSSLKKIQVTNINSSPTITSITPTNVSDGDGTGNHTFVIAGTNFLTGVTANLINNTGTTVAFDTVTRNSAVQITGVIAKSSLLNSGEPFDVEVRNTNGQSAKLLNQINLNAQPVFTTASGSLGTGNEGTSFSTASVNATDPESAGNVTFELQSGALPSGITFANTAAEGGSAVFTGTYPQVGSTTTFNFVLRAVDAASNTSSRAFSITSTHVPVRSSFTSSGTFAVPAGITAIDVLAVGGGGGSSPGNAGGSGAGGLIYFPGYPVQTGTLTVTVGNGGSNDLGQNTVVGAPGDPGKHPSGDVLTARGGGRGNANEGGTQGGSGGAGGTGQSPLAPGGQGIQPTQPGDSGAYGFGNNGGSGNPFSAGGGGGAGAGGVGGHGNANGGDGKAYTIADGTTSVYYAGGGGGYRTPGASPAGGQGGGGGAPGGNGQPGGANKGGGSGGGGPGDETGGKGIVIIAY